MFAQKTTKSIDIVNKSDIPITLTYELCHWESIRGVVNTGKNVCEKEKIIELGGIGTNSNYFSIDTVGGYRAQQTGEKDIHSNSVIVTRIASSLGEQEFVSSFNEGSIIDNELSYGDHYGETISFCWSNNEPKSPTSSNVIILDTMGTNKFYCHSLKMAN